MCWGTEDDSVESDGCCDDDNQIRPLHLLLRPAPYDEGSGHWAVYLKEIKNYFFSSIRKLIDDGGENLSLYNEELVKTKAAGKATWFTASWLDYDPFESSKLLTLCSSYDLIAKLTLKLEQFLSSLNNQSKLDDGSENNDQQGLMIRKFQFQQLINACLWAKKSRDERDLKVKDKDRLRIDFVLDNAGDCQQKQVQDRKQLVAAVKEGISDVMTPTNCSHWFAHCRKLHKPISEMQPITGSLLKGTSNEEMD
ncbi:hypothetical protein PPACK8108_LOCUS2061 [Phakopsora pachyrhizi]|uniref:Uncharacterized protein n=1 Tax=Phakopsora pachyrhizi TaxID=170000 RepID=A0AAV0AH10_PHAPC|nr:hypothetical protein PPACK8108_LOCUS2061 [Phakopsora pachyrhizi]